MENTRRNIKGTNGLYQVDINGKVFSMPRKIFNGKGFYLSKEREMKGSVNTNGYVQIEFKINKTRKMFLIHRLVANAFIINYESKPQVNHIDGNKKNNHIKNLEWCNNSENQIHAYNNGLSHRSEKAGKTPRAVIAVDLIDGKTIKEFSSVSEAVKWLGHKKNNISRVCNGKRKSCGGYNWRYKGELC